MVAVTVGSDDDAYTTRVNAELERYAEQEEVHDLPAIYDFWSARYCLPLLQELGFDGLNEFYDRHVAEQCRRVAPQSARLVSLGAGNGDTEIAIAARLLQQGIDNLELVLLELNPQMLDRAMADARRHGIEDRVAGHSVDLNDWHADRRADIYVASHSLHHVVALESLFAEVEASLDPQGVLLVNDMIGRNGHVRWPEAADLLQRIWSVAPERYRWNRFQRAVDEVYPDVDCSTEGFEGIRSQDILPLLLERFHPDVYIVFLNIADPFIDRVYGPNFDVTNPDDLAFIDALGRLDEAAIDLQLVTPTHLIASFRAHEVPSRSPRQRTPERTLRASVGTYSESETIGSAVSVEGPDDSVADIDEMARLERGLHEAWGRYHHLRQRKAVRIALTLSALRHWRPRLIHRRAGP
jgi:SAM-dependent methyltransferase